MEMAGRGFSGSYKYGYQGSEKDNEVNSADGTSYTTEFRQLDPRLGRWFSVDPEMDFTMSPYTSMNNDPIKLTDVRGNDPGFWEVLDLTIHAALESAATVLPGPAGAMVDIIHATYYASKGDMKAAQEHIVYAAAGIVVGHIVAKVVVRAIVKAGKVVAAVAVKTAEAVAPAVKKALNKATAKLKSLATAAKETIGQKKNLGDQGGLKKEAKETVAKAEEKVVEAADPKAIKADKEEAVVKDNTEKASKETPPVRENRDLTSEIFPPTSKETGGLEGAISAQKAIGDKIDKKFVDNLKKRGYRYDQLAADKRLYEKKISDIAKKAAEGKPSKGFEKLYQERIRTIDNIMKIWTKIEKK